MHLFQEYIEPLTSWLYAHPEWAFLTTLLISFAESLAIVGTIVPGTVSMTAIGILAGAGVMRIDLTILAAILGAIAGDGASFFLGYIFSDRITNIWPFRLYPNLIDYGKDFFARHGATSVLIGRFVGPVRSIIPVIAGMVRMNRWQFLLANVASAIGWSILYVLPGVLIGTASSELSTESATRLFVLIIILLVILWLSSLGIRWLLVYTHRYLRAKIDGVWDKLGQHPYWGYYYKRLSPKHENNHYSTAVLILAFLCCFIISLIMLALVLQTSWVSALNSAVYLFLQSFRTQPFDSFFIIINLLVSPSSLITLMVCFALYTCYYRDWSTLGYWLSLISTSILTIFLLTRLVPIPVPSGQLAHPCTPTFPAINLTLATAIFGFFIFYTRKHYQTISVFILRISLLILLFLAGIAPIYLGDNWLTSVMASYFIGLTICLAHWVFYRRQQKSVKHSQLLIVLSCLFMVVTAVICFSLYFNKLARLHSPYLEQYVMDDDVWWNQQQTLLPLYSTNRIGKRIGIFNIQYAGSLINLEKALKTHGWVRQSNSLFYSLLIRAGVQNSAKEIPLKTQLYLNRRPLLVMTFDPGNQQSLLVLRFWRSNYHLRRFNQTIWLGSLSPGIWAPNNHITEALKDFKFKQVLLSKKYIQELPYPFSPILLVVKELAGRT